MSVVIQTRQKIVIMARAQYALREEGYIAAQPDTFMRMGNSENMVSPRWPHRVPRYLICRGGGVEMTRGGGRQLTST